jgi:cytochrome c peroxidase
MKAYIVMGIIVTGMAVMLSSFTDTEPADKAALGKLLFFDPVLSKDKTISCASCHKPEYAFADTSAVSTGFAGRKGLRNTPTVMNVLLQKSFFWDGRAKSLEEQALAPVENPNEMNLPIEQAVLRLQKNKKYSSYFKKIFNSEVSRTNLAAAIAAFERTLETSNSPFDEWKFTDDSNAVSDAVKRGFIVFNGKGKCIKCHFGADFTANEFRNIGLFDGRKFNDSGRIAISGNDDDIGKFKTPSLRNAAVTAPYMHNGMAKTLMQVIDFYNDTEKIIPNPVNKDSVLAKPLGLTAEEKKDLEAFLLSLTDKQFTTAGKAAIKQ